MERLIGTISRGLRAPIVKEGDDLKAIVVDTVLKCVDNGDFVPRDKDILCITESILARTQKNFVTKDQIAKDVAAKIGGETTGIVFPITSRNRFSIMLRGIARGSKKVVVQFSYPGDEVGNNMVEPEAVRKAGVNPYTDVLTLDQFEAHFGRPKHTFTGMDYAHYYQELIEEEGAEAEIIFSNNPETILEYTKTVIAADIHTRFNTKRILKEAGAEVAIGLDDLLTAPVDGSGYNDQYGLLGSNKSTEDVVKLFPIKCQEFVEAVQKDLIEKTGKQIEVMIYGDGAFKDPVGKIWELADPVVSPGYTSGLEGVPNEIKLKYLADDKFANLKGAELQKAIADEIRAKGAQELDQQARLGTTPRQLTDLIGSLCDLTSGSGDKGTPFVYIQGYFDTYVAD
ncbi:MAG: coenzyme F420-0:L-glutamate ligase [Firmicutes bacterium]|nr:coenzyme F420-0:L-glutamate ligase [Bacillota bacterium]MBQ3184486.1 coenzyme F420-0:L-glutamate ligase [Bacillota bacterium]MBR1992947.1 coenzyme F420-0:L-glutamate ligase [Bacillota bacterium]MBR6799721.1 coenzyme F420-0:L-glutamate ligase [Bacillota bacterium]